MIGVQYLIVSQFCSACPVLVEGFVGERKEVAVLAVAAAVDAHTDEHDLVFDGLSAMLPSAHRYCHACLGLQDVSLAALVGRSQVLVLILALARTMGSALTG